MKKLYIVATPIGNLADISLRALEILKSADFIISEDTRHAGILLRNHEIDQKIYSYHAQSSDTKSREILTKIPENGSAAYVSDAGTPAISDPGFRLVQESIRQNIKVIPIPGPSALTALLSVSGLPTDSFIFEGFLPHKKGRQTILQSLKLSEKTVVFYESVHRFSRLLEELGGILSRDRVIVVGRELTKMYEEIFRGNLAEAQAHFTSENIKGEFVVAIAPDSFSLLGKEKNKYLEKPREKIDILDSEILKLLGERLKISRKIAENKKKQGLPKYIPEVEAEILANLKFKNETKLRDNEIEQIWQVILEISRGKV